MMGYDPATPNLPNVVSLEITTLCTRRCPMCALQSGGTRSSRPPGHADENLLHRMSNVAAAVGHVSLNGWGESLMNPHFLPLLRQLDARGVIYGFSTNGSLVDRHVARELGDLQNLHRINVSVDSPDPDIYRRLRCGPLEPVLEGVGLLAKSLDNPERLTVSSVVLAENLDSLSQFPPLLASLGVRGWVLQDLLDPLEATGLGRFPEGLGARYLIDALQSDCKKLGISVLVMPNLERRLRGKDPSIWLRTPDPIRHATDNDTAPQSRQCGNPWEHVFVDRHGLVLPCPCCPPWEENAADGQNVMGNLNEQTFEEIWHGKKFRAFRTALLEGNPPSMCATCPLVSTGPHFFKLFQAELVQDEALAEGDRVRLVVKNRGDVCWTRETPIRVGLARPRERISQLHHPSWISADRVAEVSENEVPPGGLAELQFTITPTSNVVEERFQLVAEGICWLPNTEFELGFREHALNRGGHVTITCPPIQIMPPSNEPPGTQGRDGPDRKRFN